MFSWKEIVVGIACFVVLISLFYNSSRMEYNYILKYYPEMTYKEYILLGKKIRITPET